MQTTQPSNSNVLRGVVFATLLGVALQVGGYFLARGDRSEFGWVMFCLVPFVSGFVVAAIVRGPLRIVGCAVVAPIITLSVLLFTGWEGIICCLMSAPLVFGGVAVGACLGYCARGKFVDGKGSTSKIVLLLVCCPLLIAFADRLERPYRSIEQKEVFTSTALASASRENIWQQVVRMHKLDGERPFLLKMGLPVPLRCDLDREAVGGTRTCYFHNGQITQEITEWQPPSKVTMRITGSTLQGRHWLHFQDAGYEFIEREDKTYVVRHTTITTKLYPRWYWRPLEEWGVTSEHAFVLSNIVRAAEAGH